MPVNSTLKSTIRLFPASTKQWTSLGTTDVSVERPVLRESPKQEVEGSACCQHENWPLLHTLSLFLRRQSEVTCPEIGCGSFSWGSECCTQTRITDVVYNASSNELVHTETLVKNCAVLMDSTTYRQWYRSPWATRRGPELTPEEEEILKQQQRKLEELR